MTGMIHNKIEMYKRVVSFIDDFPEIKEHPDINRYINRLYEILENIILIDRPSEPETQSFIDKIAMLKSQLIDRIMIVCIKLHELSKSNKDIKVNGLTNINKGQLCNILNYDLIKRVDNILFFAVRNSRILKSKGISSEYINCLKKLLEEFRIYQNLYNVFKIKSSADFEKIKTVLIKEADNILVQLDFIIQEIFDEEIDFYELYIKARILEYDVINEIEDRELEWEGGKALN